MPIRTRLFVVGCPRSGTTLVQSLLAAHPDVVSVPETHFFHALRRIRLLTRRPGVTRGRERAALEALLQQIDRADLVPMLPVRRVSRRQWIQAFVEILDRVAADVGAQVWVEKTPGHLGYINLIAATVPGARFVHVLRRGPDVVASMVEATREHPDAWGGARTPVEVAKRWLRDLAKSEAYVGDAAHVVACYERVVADPEAAAALLCRQLGLEPDPSMVRDYAEAASSLVNEGERWKDGVFDAIRSTPAHKFDSVLAPQERAQVLQVLEGWEPRLKAMCA